MKLLYALLAPLISLSASAQTVPLKGANIVYIALPDSGVAAWRKATQTLLARGYSFRYQDKDMLAFRTEFRPVNKAIYTNVTGFIKGRTLALRGAFAIGAFLGEATPIAMRGMKGSATLVAWEEFDAVAKAMGGRVSYKKE